jgi:hypothetical protein
VSATIAARRRTKARRGRDETHDAGGRVVDDFFSMGDKQKLGADCNEQVWPEFMPSSSEILSVPASGNDSSVSEEHRAT